MSKVTDKLKMTRVRLVGAKQAAEIIDIAQFLGFRWAGGQKPKDYPTVSPSWIMVDSNCRIFNPSEDIGNGYTEYDQVSTTAWTVAKGNFKRERTAKKKAQRAKKNPWLKNIGTCPVAEGELVDVKYRDGAVEYAIKALVPHARKGQRLTATHWHEGHCSTDITHYRIVKPQPVQPPKVRTTKPDNKVSVGQLIDAFKEGKPVGVVVGPDTNPKLEGTTYSFDTNPKTVGNVDSDERGSGARYNAGKPDFSLIPLVTMEGEARVWAYGAKKYKAWNWMKGMDWSVPYACAIRHLAAFQRGEDVDPETLESHIDHAMCNLRMLKYYTEYYKEGDDRPKQFFIKEYAS